MSPAETPFGSFNEAYNAYMNGDGFGWSGNFAMSGGGGWLARFDGMARVARGLGMSSSSYQAALQHVQWQRWHGMSRGLPRRKYLLTRIYVAKWIARQ